MRGPTLQLQELNLRLGNTVILNNINFKVNAGGIHALVGPNGSGKSSLLKTILGQMPHQGKVVIDWPKQQGVIAYVPQALEFDRTLPMTVDDFMSIMVQKRPVLLGMSKPYKRMIGEALEQVGMLSKRKRRMGALSGGERQRLMLAQALIPMPDLLILDEPMAALDEPGMEIFEGLLNQWHQQGVTVLWVEHDLVAVRRLANRVTGLNRQVIFEGEPELELSAEKLMHLFSLKSGRHVLDTRASLVQESV